MIFCLRSFTCDFIFELYQKGSKTFFWNKKKNDTKKGTFYEQINMAETMAELRVWNHFERSFLQDRIKYEKFCMHNALAYFCFAFCFARIYLKSNKSASSISKASWSLRVTLTKRFKEALGYDMHWKTAIPTNLE